MPKFLDTPTWYGSDGAELSLWETAGASGQALISNGGGSAPAWKSSAYAHWIYFHIQNTTTSGTSSELQFYLIFLNNYSSAYTSWPTLSTWLQNNLPAEEYLPAFGSYIQDGEYYMVNEMRINNRGVCIVSGASSAEFFMSISFQGSSDVDTFEMTDYCTPLFVS